MNLNKASTGRRRQSPSKLERLILDADVNPRIVQYLQALGFDVLFSPNVSSVDIHDDRKMVRWARWRNRILICHDRFKDRQTRMRVFLEVFQNGGKVIRIAGAPQQPILTSLGKLLVHRDDWLKFFSENVDGIATVHMTGMHTRTREDFYTTLQQMQVDPYGAIERPRRRGERRPRRGPDIPEQQMGPFL